MAPVRQSVSMADHRRSLRRWQLAGIGAAVALGMVVVLWLCLAFLPPRFVPGDDLDERKVQNDVRTTLVQGLGGIVLGVGAYFTARQLRTSRQAQEILREGQITERYTRAVDQLGHAEIDVRIGGIYALERIARDSPYDRPTIGEVLTWFVRGRSPWPPTRPGQFRARAPLAKVVELPARSADVQAAITVLSRSGFSRALRLDLNRVDLRRANLQRAHLEGADLFGAHFEGANLHDADLEGAHLASANLELAVLSEAHLKRATLAGANLKEATLIAASLEGAHLGQANLERAILLGANLEGAYLRGANLERAILKGANLEGANLDGARLAGAMHDGSTRWPEGFELDSLSPPASEKRSTESTRSTNPPS